MDALTWAVVVLSTALVSVVVVIAVAMASAQARLHKLAQDMADRSMAGDWPNYIGPKSGDAAFMTPSQVRAEMHRPARKPDDEPPQEEPETLAEF